MKLSIQAGSTSQSVNIFVQDSSKTDGSGLTGLVFNTASLTAYYTFAGASATATAITLATLAAVNSAWSSGGFKELDATHMPGAYRLDLPNAVLAGSNGRSVLVYLRGATNMAPCVLEIELTAWDNQRSYIDASATRILGTLLTETTGGNLASAVAHFFDVSPTARATINTVSITTDLAAVPTNFALMSIDGSGRVDVGKTLGQAVTLDANNIMNVNAKDFGGIAQTGFDVGLLANHLSTTLELDPNSADPQNSLTASTYRFTSGTLHNQYKEIVNGMNAYDVFGQVDFYTDSGTVNQSTTAAVTGVAYDPVNNYLFEAEGPNNRILVFNATPSSPNKAAIHVLGQTNFTNHSANEGGSPTANSLSNPNGVFYDTTSKFLWVCDSGNHRVGYYDLSSGISDHMAFTHVLGQANKTSGTANRGGGTGANTLNFPYSVVANSSLNLIAVSDANNNRVCTWGAPITVDGQSANSFLGQLNSTSSGAGSTASTLSSPSGLALDANNIRLFVGDTGNARCMIWFSSLATGATADNVLGQPNFSTHNSGRRTRAGIFDPGTSFAYDPERDWLVIPEQGNFRVTIWDVAPATLVNGPLALYVLNQSSFVDDEFAVSPNRTFTACNAVAIDKINDRLFVGEQLSVAGRVKVFQLHNYLRRNQAVDFPNMTEPAASYFASNTNHVNGNLITGLSVLYAMAVNERDETSGSKTLLTQAGGTIGTATITTNGTTFVNHGKFS